ncbi:MAG TPA: ATP-binding protein [Candidatus Dormibacteraeota bacterium]|nr:ATP-binding protein [Candidatus Dormibacteraeota bacterium]
MRGRKAHRIWLAVAGLVVALLLAAVFTLGSLDLPISPQGRNLTVLFALSTFIVAALLVFLLVLGRSLVRLWADHRSQQLGSRFKTRMVLGAMAISLLPVIFLFFVSYALMNRTLNKWFPRPLEIATEQSRKLLDSQVASSCHQLDRLAAWAAQAPTDRQALGRAVQAGADVAWIARPNQPATALWSDLSSPPAAPLRLARRFPGGAELFEAGSSDYFFGSAALAGPTLPGATLLVGRRAPRGFLAQLNRIEAETQSYWQEQQALRAYKKQILLALLLFTVLVLSAVTWVALFLSKTVTVPIQALAEATGEISRGNFEHRVKAQAQDELGVLVNSFNQMTAQLGESRRQIEDSKRNLERALEEIESRRRLMTTLLENVPTGVILLDTEYRIAQSNPAVARIFGDRAPAAGTLDELMGESAARRVMRLAHRSRRIGAVSSELEIDAAGRLLHAAVTVSSLGPPRSERGFIVVIDDLTELLRAQKSAAWQEVAKRIAHEIKNPLTPIRLSAGRLLRHAERQNAGPGTEGEFVRVVAECAGLIGKEVETLKSLVDEFSQFARFPSARLEPADLNEITRNAIETFQDRLDGIRLHADLAPERLPVNADAELLRGVLVNLIDNAAEAMEGSPVRELQIETRLCPSADSLEVIVADTGHGISPEDKDRLFLPHFSTRNRGTGLGLAIASRVIAEHHGTIQVDDNLPFGTRFVIRMPAAELRVEEARS